MRAFAKVVAYSVLSPLSFAAVLCSVAGAQTPPPPPPPPAAGQVDARALTQMSHEAVRIFKDTDKALMSLNNGNTAAAQNDIKMAMMVRNRLAMTAKSHQLAKVVPLYSEFEQDETLGTIMAKKNNGTAPPSTNAPVTIDGVNDQFTFVGIDLDKTKARLQGAEDALKNNNPQAAKDTLNAIGDDLVVAKVGSQAPLLAVRENLGLAHMAAAQHHTKEATAALQQASGELAAYAQNSGAPHAQDATQLKANVDAMLKGDTQRQAGAAMKIGGWWSEVNGWMGMPNA